MVHDKPDPARPRRLPAAPALLPAVLLALACAGPAAETRQAAPVAPPDRGDILGPPRQLSFEGRRSGEGYFSRDGSLLVFQSERDPANPFYQIYLMDLETGDVERVSPGVGKTTCAWIHPSGRRVLFSSTHLDPRSRTLQQDELERRASGETRRYEWDFDPHYEIWSVGLPLEPDAAPTRLTNAFGYDAEASWSPDGRSIVFASNRHVYAQDGSFRDGLSAADRARAEIDPSRFVDLYIMDARGGPARRLTDHDGYDGGPFFSPDGKRIVFRRFTPEGDRAEIFSIRSDGSDLRQLTKLQAMSWAPFYHPSGDYVVFTTNVHGFQNFELYVVDAEGESPPVRVTEQDGADLLPVFAPSGDELVYTRKPPGGSSQLYRADWNDEAARARLGLAARSFHGAGPVLPVPEPLDAEIAADELRRFVTDLSSEPTEGRLTGTTGEKIATGYVARVFRSAGLEPAGDAGTFFHDFGFTAGVSLGPGNLLRAVLPDTPAGRELVLDQDWRPLSFSQVGPVHETGVVFAGYGLVAPAEGDAPEVDDYAHLDVEGKWVMVLRYMPAGLDEDERRRLNRQSSLRYKAMVARDRGAVGILFVSGPASRVREELVGLRSDASLAGTSIAVASLSDEAANLLVQAGSRHDLEDLQKALDRGIGMPGFELEGVRLGGTIDVQQQRRKGRNVLGRLPASRPPPPGPDGLPGAPRPVVLVGAHVDHLGRGDVAGSLARGEDRDRIHPGADDNASGVAALFEIAAWLADAQRQGRLETTRDVVFAAWSGEELGLLGSAAWARDELAKLGPRAPGEPQDDLSPRVAAYLNLDMVGRLREHLTLLGVDSSPVWPGEIERSNVPVGLSIVPVGDTYLPTDATTFYLERVPILSAFTGSHEEYHTPRDRPESLDYDALADVTRLMAGISRSLARSETEPAYVASAQPGQGLPRAGLRVYLGTIPDYAQTDARPGLRLSGVAAGGPAEQAGLQAGDLVIEVDGRRIENIYDYTYALDGLQVGVPVKIVVLRGDSRTAVQLTPASRE